MKPTDPISEWQDVVRQELIRYSMAKVQGVDSLAGQVAQQAIARATGELVKEVFGPAFDQAIHDAVIDWSENDGRIKALWRDYLGDVVEEARGKATKLEGKAQ